MAINVASLTKYVDEQRVPLIGKAVLASKTAKLLNIQTGVKDTAALNLVNTVTTLGDGSVCGWNDLGTSTLSQRKIEVGACKVNKSFCDKTLLPYWAGYEVKVAAGTKTLPFEEEFINAEIDNVGAIIEKALWQGDKTSADANLNKFDGLIKILAADGAIIAPNANIKSVTSSNILAGIDSVYASIPAAVLETSVILMGTDFFRLASVALRDKNWFHYSNNVDESMELIYPGTSTKVIGVNGLNGTGLVVALDPQNAFYGTDLEGDAETFKLWYSDDNQEFRLAINFMAGVQVAFPDQVVTWGANPANIAVVLTTPAAGAGVSLVAAHDPATIAIEVPNSTASVVMTGTKTAAVTYKATGTHAAFVTIAGTALAPTVTVNTTAIKTTGGTYTFNLIQSELGKSDFIYAVTIVVAGS